jgi:hypothetical protein
MNEQDDYKAWVASKTAGGAPEGFADRVMKRVHAERAALHVAQPSAAPVPGEAWWDRTWILAGAWAAASLLLLVRLLALVAVLSPH